MIQDWVYFIGMRDIDLTPWASSHREGADVKTGKLDGRCREKA